MDGITRAFERMLWGSRLTVLVAVVSSLIAALVVFFIATVDVYLLVKHAAHYAASDLASEARRLLRDETIGHVIEVVDGYLLSTVLLIFSLGLYELFIGDINAADGSPISSRVLVIESLDDLKSRLAKVILMILIVKLFEYALKVQVTTALDMLWFAGSLALVGLALYLSHASEKHDPAPAAD